MLKRTRVVINLCSGLVAVGLIGPVAVWSMDPTVPIKVGSAEVLPPEGGPGDRLVAYYKVNVLKQCTLITERHFEDKAHVNWPTTKIVLENRPIGEQTLRLTMNVPMDAEAGPARINNWIGWACNPWQQVFPRWEKMPSLQVAVKD